MPQSVILTCDVLWWVTCLIWSSVCLFIKLGLRDLPPVSFAAVRLVVAIAVFLPILADPPRAAAAARGATGLSSPSPACCCSGVNYVLLFWGAQFIPSGLTAVLRPSRRRSRSCSATSCSTTSRSP